MHRENYNALVDQQASANLNFPNRYDPHSIEQKMKKLKFAKMNQQKDSNWFKKIQVGITEEDEKQI